MGFTTGFIGGVTLTTAILYFSLNLHQRNRIYQSTLLRQQSTLLTNTLNPPAPTPPPTSREIRAGVSERVKDKWNAELESNVRKLQNLDWDALRTGAEERVAGLWARAFEGSREGVEVGGEKVKEVVGHAVEQTRESVNKGAARLANGAWEGVGEGVEGAKAVALAKRREG